MQVWGAQRTLVAITLALGLCLLPVQAQEQPPELEAIYQRGLQLYEAGKVAEAVPIAEEYIAVAAAKFGKEHPLYATGLGYLGVLYEALNRPSEAEPLFKRALSIKEKALGPDHLDLGDTLHNLAELYRKQGRLAEAEPLYQRAVSIAERALGPAHRSVGIVLGNMAELYRMQGRHAESEPLAKRSVAIREEAAVAAQPIGRSGADEPAGLLSQVNQLYQAGKYAEAIPIAERYVQTVEARHGKEGAEYALALTNLGELFRVTNRLAEAEPLIRRSLTINEKNLGPDHPTVAVRLNNLALLLQATNRFAEAEPLYRRALAINERSNGPDDPIVANNLNNLAVLLEATNRLAEAEPLFKRALLIKEKMTNPQGTGQLGVEINDLTKEEADKLGLPVGRGVRVVRVVDGGPAELAGVLLSDILLSLDGSDITGAKETVAEIRKRKPGTQVLLHILRGGTERTMVAILGNAAQTVGDNSPQLMLDTGGHTGLIKELVFTSDGKQLVSAGEDKVIRVWDWQTGSTMRTIRGQVAPGPEGRIFAIALSPDGRWLAAAGWMAQGFWPRSNEVGDIRLYDFATGNLVGLLRGHGDAVNSLAFLPDGKLLISGSADHTAILWDVGDRRLVHQLRGHTQSVYATGFTRDGKSAVTGSLDATLKLWSVNDGKEISTLLGTKTKYTV
jgi:tetratricopeptide (TPR) repeat protein